MKYEVKKDPFKYINNNSYNEIVSELLLYIPKNYINIDLAIKYILSIDHFDGYSSKNIVLIETKKQVNSPFKKLGLLHNSFELPCELSDVHYRVWIFNIILVYIKQDEVDTDGEEKFFNQFEIYQRMLLNGTILERALKDGYIVKK